MNDAVPATNYPNDLDNETSKHNYKYNGIGELASDSSAGIDSITWTVYGKVKKIVKTNGDSIVFEYDPLGNRLEKRNYTHHDTITDTVKYARDAQGNILAVYDRKKDTVRLTELDLYGSKRIGVIDTVMRMKKPAAGGGSLDSLRLAYLEGQRQYEITNHLGNVLATVDDRKLPVDTGRYIDSASYYYANVVNAQDYYPFGMPMPGRTYTIANDSSYGYGYQGSMKDNNIYGNGNTITTKDREEELRLPNWLAPDPVFNPSWSPYVTMSDNPIVNNDVNGDTTIYYSQAGKRLFTSSDGLATGITIIDDSKLKEFQSELNLYQRPKYKNGKSMHLENLDSPNSTWRTYGKTFDVDALRNFYKNNTKDGVDNLNPESTTGKMAPGYFNEVKGYLYNNNGFIKPGKLAAIGDIGTAIELPEKEAHEGAILGIIHTHPNEGKADDFPKTFASGPSTLDYQNSDVINHESEVNAIVGPKNIYLYGPGLGTATISVDKKNLQTAPMDNDRQ